jgi:hypothetical protein
MGAFWENSCIRKVVNAASKKIVFVFGQKQIWYFRLFFRPHPTI